MSDELILERWVSFLNPTYYSGLMKVKGLFFNRYFFNYKVRHG